MRLSVELRRQVGMIRTPGPRTRRAAGLRHEALNHAVKYDAVVETVTHKRLDTLHMLWCKVRPQRYHNAPFGGVDD